MYFNELMEGLKTHNTRGKQDSVICIFLPFPLHSLNKHLFSIYFARDNRNPMIIKKPVTVLLHGA